MNGIYRAEANIQAEFYYHCKRLELRVALEMSTPVGRLDAAVVTPDDLILKAIVECKRNGIIPRLNSRQMRRYKTIGVPIFVLNEFEQAEKLALQIKETLDKIEGKPIIEVLNMPRVYRNPWRRQIRKLPVEMDDSLIIRH